MKLYLVQHGEAVAKEENPDRPLSDRGRRDVERVAEALAAAGIGAGQVLHSGKDRARQTAEILAEVAARGGLPQARDGLSPNDPVAPVAAEAAGWEQDTLIAGHQPFVGRLAARLLTGRDDGAVIGFQPGTVVCLERDAESGGWALAWMLRPELAAAFAR